MTVNVLFAAGAKRWRHYREVLGEAVSARGIAANIQEMSVADFAPEETDYIIYAPDTDLQDFRPFIRAKSVLSLWAGVERIAENPTLHIPLCRMVDPALTQGMVEWVVGHVLRLHLGMDAHIFAKPGEWNPVAPPLAFDTTVTVLGLGRLGTACATALQTLGFQVSGWSRTPKAPDNITCFSGRTELRNALENAQFCVLLLPETPDTRDIIDAQSLAWMPKGARLLNPGRGPLIDDAALVDALDSDHIGHATLDVFRQEPLPATHAFWRHPKVTVTPHIASETRPEYAAKTLAENIKRGEAGMSFLNVVDPVAGY